jgi:phospholipid transport system substrate-binding protein
MVMSSRKNGLRPAATSLAAVAVVVAILGRPATAQSAPTDDVRSFYGTLLTTMQYGPSLGPSGRYQRLEPAVTRLFDIPLMARLATGPGWDGLDANAKQQVAAAFGRYIAATYADRFDRYSGERLEVVGQQPQGANLIVETRIVKSDGDPVTINYLMQPTAGGWQVADIYLDGTISQLAVQRSEFAEILSENGVAGLIAKLNEKADFLTKTS